MNDSPCVCIFGLIVIIILIWLLKRSSSRKSTASRQIGNHSAISSSKEVVRHITTSPNERFIEVDPGIRSNTPHATFSYSYENVASRFIKDAWKYHGVEGKVASPTPLKQYWPTFEGLSPEQKKWYFYWRSEVRQGRYPTTDLSYIFVYVYELLCLVENSDPIKAAELIKSIWREYRSHYENLDKYLPEWGGDLVTVKVGLSQGITWWQEFVKIDKIQPPIAIANVIIQKAVEAGRVNELPYSVWSGLNLYHPQNKFYQRYNRDGSIDLAYLKAINAVDKYFSKLPTPKGLLERFTSPKLYPQRKGFFNSALVPDSYHDQINLGEARNYASSSRLGNILTALTKYTENILRKQKHFSARLSGFDLEERLQRVLDEAFASPPEKETEKPIRIAFDTRLIQALQQQSDQVSELLEIDADDEDKPLYSDISQVRTLWEKLDFPAKRLVLSIYSHKIEDISQVTAGVIGVDISPLVLIDRINNLSIPLLGDRIISVQNHKQVMIADDFVDEMELIAKENPIEFLLIPSTEPLTEKKENPWQCFLQQLSKDESELLSQFASKGSLGETEIEKFAHSRGLMGNLLIDSISEKAIELLGRTPFYQEESSWFIEEEDLAMLHEIVCT